MDATKITSVSKTIFVSGALARGGEGKTVGNIQKHVGFLTKGQIQRVLDELVYEGYAYFEVKAHGKTGKKVYHMTEAYAIELSYIAREYSAREIMGA